MFKIAVQIILFPKESSLENSSIGSSCFCRDFTCFMVWKFWDPYDLCLYCGGWVVVVVVGRILPKKEIFLFSSTDFAQLLYISKQNDVLITDMISKIGYGFLIKSSEHVLLFLCRNKNIQLVFFWFSVIPLCKKIFLLHRKSLSTMVSMKTGINRDCLSAYL